MSPSAAQRVFPKLLVVLYVLSGVSGYETFASSSLEVFNNIKVIRVDAAAYVALKINRPAAGVSDFPFMCEYAYERLSNYNFGDNFEGAIIPQTTPMFYSMDVLDMSAPRKIAFALPKDVAQNPPAPRMPLHLEEKEEKYFFVRPTNETDLAKILHAAADLLTDLSYASMPFFDSNVLLALYNYPPELDITEEKRDNEIWVERSLVHEGFNSGFNAAT